MCTAINLTLKDNYFGRNLDYEHDFGEQIIITPRNYPIYFRNGRKNQSHYAIIGMGIISDNYPLYFDASNEKGVSMAGLNFPGSAEYKKAISEKDNIASFELILWVLSQAENVEEAKRLTEKLNITDEAFSDKMPSSPLHWIIADKHSAIVIEQTKIGLSVYDNPVGVLTNNPCFDMQMINVANYMSLSNGEPKNRFSDKISIAPYSRGMGGIGLPGDLSSMSRFVRAAFVKLNSEFEHTETEIIAQFFHILASVYQQKGCAKVGEGYEITNYSSCCNTDKGIYYYTTYYNSSVNAVDMHRENLDLKALISYKLIKKQNINMCN